MPIVDAVLRERDANGGRRRPGVKALVVYPMNALASSQVRELEKFLRCGYGEGDEPVTFARYIQHTIKAEPQSGRLLPPHHGA